jgi:hypothetical protein
LTRVEKKKKGADYSFDALRVVQVNLNYGLTPSPNETPIDWQGFVGGKLVVGGGEPVMITNADGTAATLTTSTLDVPVSLVDDDDNNTLLPYANPSLAWLKTVMKDAYVKVVNDGGGDTNNNKQTVPFVLNVYDPDAIMSSANAFESSGNRGDDFWIVWLCSAYQPVAVPGENYGLTKLGGRADGDPDSETKLVAIAPYGGALLFRESIRDGGAASYGLSTTAIESPLVAHELGHSFDLLDRDEDSDPVNRHSIMGYFWLSNGFAPADGKWGHVSQVIYLA